MATLPVDQFTHVPIAQPYWLCDRVMENGRLLVCKGFRNGKPHYIGPPGVMKPRFVEGGTLPEEVRQLWREWADERYSSPTVFPDWTCSPDSKAGHTVMIR